MTRKWGDTGLAVMGSRHVLTITYPDPDETLLETPEAVPTSEPGAPQVEYTIAAGHLPNIGGASAVWTPMLWASGHNDTAGSITLSYRLMKNDVSVQTGTQSVTAGRYWTVNCYNYYDSAVGDKIQLSLSASGAGLDWRYKGLFIYPTRIDLGAPLYLAEYTIDRLPDLALGVPLIVIRGNWYTYASDSMYHIGNAVDSFAHDVVSDHADYHGGRPTYGDIQQTNSSTTSSSYYPYYIYNHVPTQIVYYPLSVR